jgi:mRNA interferase RelE/StbE
VAGCNIEFDRKALKDFRSIPVPVPVAKRIKTAIAQLAEDPYPLGHKRLQGQLRDYVRIRVGDYRVIYSIEQEALVVLVIRVGHRGEIYKKL